MDSPVSSLLSKAEHQDSPLRALMNFLDEEEKMKLLGI